MKFQVALPDFEAALQLVKSSMSAEASDMSGHFLFRKSIATPGRVEVLTHNRYTQSLTTFVAEIESGDESPFTIYGKGLTNFLDALCAEGKNSTVTVDFDPATAKSTVYSTLSPKRKYPFGSLGPDAYPDFGQKLQRAQLVGTCDSTRLLESLEAAKGFVNTDEQKGGETTIAEFRDGTLMATNLQMLCLVKMPDLKDCKLRLQIVQHLPDVMSFLSTCKGFELEILEAEESPGQSSGMFFLRRGDGTVFGWSLYTKPFPKIAQPKEKDDIWWKINSKSLSNGIKGIFAGLKGGKAEPVARFSRPDPKGPVLLSAATESDDAASWDIEVLESGQSDDVDIATMPESFQLSRGALEILLKATKVDPIVLGINYKAAVKKGYLRVLESRGEKSDEFLFMLAWWRDSQP